MAARIRVMRVIARLNVGGPAVYATLLTDGLDPARYDSLLVAGSEDVAEGNYLELRRRPLDRVHGLPALGRDIRGGADVRALAGLYRLMRRVRPHVVHTHTAKAGTLGRLAALLARVPVIVHTYHGHVFRGYFSPARTRLFLAIERTLGRHTSRLTTESEGVRQELLGFGIGRPDRFSVLAPGLDLAPLLGSERVRGALRRELDVAPDAVLIGIVARLVPIKAHEVFLDAAARLAARRPAARFLVVGDGECRGALEARAARLGLADRVRFLGWRADLDRVYADLDIVALTSDNEGSPVALIEALAAARPVVATRVGGVPDLIEDGRNGLLVPPRDPAALAAALDALLADPARQAGLGRAGRVDVTRQFGAARLLADVDVLYTTLLAERGVRLAAPAGQGAARSVPGRP
jgi:glycosyltransferase involved in cell wall biosynthesis